MQESTFQTLQIAAIGAKNPTPIALAATIVIRVLVRNVGPSLVFLASARGDVDPQKGPSPGAYRLPPGASDVFVLAPKQQLLALAVGAGAMLSTAISEAIPLDGFKA